MKGQAAIEFMTYVSVLTFILAIFLWSSTSLEKRKMGIKTMIEAENFCDGIAFEINSAVRSGDGYSRKFHVDDSFYGVSSFDISVNDYFVYIDWADNFVSSSIIIKNLTNTNTISPGFNFIENRDGDVYVTSI